MKRQNYGTASSLMKERDQWDAYRLCLKEMWARHRILVFELHHIQQVCAARTGSLKHMEEARKRLLYECLDVPLKSNNELLEDSIPSSNHRQVNRLYSFAGALREDLIEDHLLIKSLLLGTTKFRASSALARQLASNVWNMLADTPGASIDRFLSISGLEEVLEKGLRKLVQWFVREAASRSGPEKLILSATFRRDLTNEVVRCFRPALKGFPLRMSESLKDFLRALYSKMDERELIQWFRRPSESTALTRLLESGWEGLEEKHSGTVDEGLWRTFYFLYVGCQKRIETASNELLVLSRKMQELVDQTTPYTNRVVSTRRTESSIHEHFLHLITDKSAENQRMICIEILGCKAAVESGYNTELLHVTAGTTNPKILNVVRDSHHQRWVEMISCGPLKLTRSAPGQCGAIVGLSAFSELPSEVFNIGHEVAHHVIKELLGINNRPELLIADARYGLIGLFLKEYHNIIGRFFKSAGLEYEPTLHIEVLADFLALCEFGGDYLASWFTSLQPSSKCDTTWLCDEFDRVNLAYAFDLGASGVPGYLSSEPSDVIRGLFMAEIVERSGVDQTSYVIKSHVIRAHAKRVALTRYNSSSILLKLIDELEGIVRWVVTRARMHESYLEARKLFVSSPPKILPNVFSQQDRYHPVGGGLIYELFLLNRRGKFVLREWLVGISQDNGPMIDSDGNELEPDYFEFLERDEACLDPGNTILTWGSRQSVRTPVFDSHHILLVGPVSIAANSPLMLEFRSFSRAAHDSGVVPNRTYHGFLENIENRRPLVAPKMVRVSDGCDYCKGLLLGGYDYFELRPADVVQGVPRPNGMMIADAIPSVIRRRVVREVWRNLSDPDELRLGGFICIQLINPGLRLIFLIWLNTWIARNWSLLSACWTSTGWEDVVIGISSFQPKHLASIEELACHPFVKRTETLFSGAALQMDLGPGVSWRSYVKVFNARDFLTALDKSGLSRHIRCFQIHGYFDYELEYNRGVDAAVIWRDLDMLTAYIAKLHTEPKFLKSIPSGRRNLHSGILQTFDSE